MIALYVKSWKEKKKKKKAANFSCLVTLEAMQVFIWNSFWLCVSRTEFHNSDNLLKMMFLKGESTIWNLFHEVMVVFEQW